eukprot:1785511-Rhodomonas_salina.1
MAGCYGGVGEVTCGEEGVTWRREGVRRGGARGGSGSDGRGIHGADENLTCESGCEEEEPALSSAFHAMRHALPARGVCCQRVRSTTKTDARREERMEKEEERGARRSERKM